MPAGFYSPIVHPEKLPPQVWERRAPMPGIGIDLDAQLTLIERDLGRFIQEFQPPLRGPQLDADAAGFFLENPYYGPMDSHILYAMVRGARPRRVLELGSGFSTLVIQDALRANSIPAEHDVVDPYPSQRIRALGDRVRLRAGSAVDIPDADFAALGPGDILFVDTSHVLRPGGEVGRIVLEGLPLLDPGVLIHFHDIFRPFEYPRVLYDRYELHWQEQYLLQAFLAYNPRFAVTCSNHLLWRTHAARLMPLFPGLQEWMVPSALWLTRIEA